MNRLITVRIKPSMLFQGNMVSEEYFEGWYYKQVSKDERTAISLIPGISLAKGDHHCFVQYIYVRVDEVKGKTVWTGYHKYPLSDFIYDDEPFMIQIANNVFTESAVSVNLEDQDMKIEAAFSLGPFQRIKKSLLMPNMMGYFAYFPKMECYHDVISMNHRFHGLLRVNEEAVDFHDGTGYIEKDWGTSFPKKYIWIQCNNFKKENVSVFCSVADIPFRNKSFMGFICSLMINDQEYRFATYNNSKLKIESITADQINLCFQSSSAKLSVEASMTHTGELIAPQQGRMQNVIKEGLSGKVKIRYYNKQSGMTYEDTGNMAGIEICGFTSNSSKYVD